MVWAVLVGKFDWKSVAEIDEFGHHTEKALPYVKHLASDLQAAGCYQGLQAGVDSRILKSEHGTI